MKVTILLVVFGVSILLCGCGSSSEAVKTKIVRSKLAFLESEKRPIEEFPPHGVLQNGMEADPLLTERRFYNPKDTIVVEKGAELVDAFTPEYPAEAQTRYMEGTVWVRLWVTAEGTVKQARVEESTDVIFNESALNAGMNYRFKNAVKDQRPVQVSVFVPIHYKLK